MTIHPLLAIIDAPIIIGILIVGALLFGADKLPKLARSAGAAKKEFLVGQAEADEAAAKAREEARQRAAAEADEAAAKAQEEARQRAAAAQADVMNNVEAGQISGEAVPPPTPGSGTQSS
jgi:sec-independent protein translocase protein TatA